LDLLQGDIWSGNPSPAHSKPFSTSSEVVVGESSVSRVESQEPQTKEVGTSTLLQENMSETVEDLNSPPMTTGNENPGMPQRALDKDLAGDRIAEVRLLKAV